MGSQTSKVQQVDEEFSNHSSINFETEEAPIDTKAFLKRGNEMSPDEQNLIGERNNYFLKYRFDISFYLLLLMSSQ